MKVRSACSPQRHRLPAIAFLAGSLFFFYDAAFAAPLTWTASGQGDWLNSSNWNPANVPNSSSNVDISNGGTATLSTPGTYGISSISVGTASGGGALVVDSATLNPGWLGVGNNGAGTLTLNNNAQVNSTGYNYLDIGLGRAGDGLVVINNGTLSSQQYLNIGASGLGTLILNQGQVLAGYNYSVRIGEQPGSSGQAIVNGGTLRGSIGEDNFVVGREGVGTLTVNNSGIASSSWMFVGGEYRGTSYPTSRGGTGTVTLNDSSVLRSSAGIVIGGAGSKGDVIVNDAAQIENNASFYIGYGGEGSLTLNGGQARGTSATVGVNSGAKGTLNIFNQGGLISSSGIVGNASNSTGDALISGSGAEWRISGALYVGGNGVGTLTLQNSGTVSASSATLGPGATGVGTINIGAAADKTAAAAGRLASSGLNFGPGTGTLNFNHTDTNYEFSPVLMSTGAGTHTLNHQAGQTTLTGANTAFSAAINVRGGTLAVSAPSSTSTQNLGSGAVFVDANGTLAAHTNDAFSFDNALTGTGTLSASNAGAAFELAPGVGNAFAGTVNLGNNQFALGDAQGANDNTAALANATLMLSNGNVTKVGTGVQTIGALVLNGGTIAFDVTEPNETTAGGTIQTTNGLDVSGPGSVGIHLPGGVILPTRSALIPSHSNLFDQQKGIGGVSVQLIASQGLVSGTAGHLKMVDDNGAVITNGQVIDLLQGGNLAAQGTYDYRLTTGRNQDGLYAIYGLTQLNLIGTQTNALTLNLKEATGNVTDMDVRITGAGDLAIDAATSPTGVISLSNMQNDYQGVTDVRSGTLALANTGALGKTSELQIQSNATADLAGFSQNVGKLTTLDGSTLNLNGGTLTITDALRQPGDTSAGALANNTLLGAGQLIIDPSIMPIDGVQAGFTGTLSVEGGSTAVLNTANAFDEAVGTGGVAGVGIQLASAADTLIFGDLSQHSASTITGITGGTSNVVIAGSGQVHIMDGMQVSLINTNTYSGGTTIGPLSTLALGNGGTTGAIAGNVTNQGTLIFNRSDATTFSGLISGAGIVRQGGTGTTTLSTASAYTGPTEVVSGTLAAGAANVLSANSAFQVAQAGRLDLAGFNQTVSSLNNAGVVSFVGPQNIVMTVTNEYVSNGGTIISDTTLGSDGSLTDRLVAGSVTLGAGGATRLLINNTGGLGALTVNDGIEVVHVTGGPSASAANAFVLGSQVKAGAYEYTLFQHGSNTANGNWYLRSSYDGPVDPVGPVGPTDPYRPEVPVYMSSQALASKFGLAMLGSCDDRAGGYVGAQSATCGDGPAGQAVWGRFFVEKGKTKYGGSGIDGRVQSFESHGPTYDYTLGGIQTGMDLYRAISENGSRNIAGVYLGAGRAKAKVDSAGGGRAGRVEMEGYSLGLYATHKSALGWYVDAVAQGTRYRNIKADSDDGEHLKSNGWGVVASLETGYPFALGNNWSLTPQAQVIYQRLSLDGGSDNFGTIDYRTSNAAYGRLGAKLDKHWTQENGRLVTGFVQANLWRHFGSKATTDFNTHDGLHPVSLQTQLGGSWAQLGLGITGQVSQQVSLYGSADYSFAVDQGKGHGFGGMVGIKVQW